METRMTESVSTWNSVSLTECKMKARMLETRMTVGSDIEFCLLDGVHDERMNDGNPHDRVGPDMEFSLLDGVHDERRINGNPHDRVGLDMEFSLLDGVHDDRILRIATNDSGLQDELG